MEDCFDIQDLNLRPIQEPGDMLLLQHIYATSRDYEMGYYGFPEPDLTYFLTDQFILQHRQYMNALNAKFYIIETLSGEPLGRFYTREMSYPEIRVIDIAILPAHRGRGIGMALFEQTMNQAKNEGKRVSIHVEKQNPAHGFYEKLGFGFVHVDGIYDLMVWPATQAEIAKKAQEIDKQIAHAKAASLAQLKNSETGQGATQKSI